MFGLFSTQKTRGLIAYFRAEDWWLNTFTDAERKHIVEVTKPEYNQGFGIDFIGEDIEFTTADLPSTFASAAGWFKNEKDRTIAYRFLDKALSETETISDVVALHFLYQNCIEIYYRFRELDNFAYNKAKAFCLKQIEINDSVANQMRKDYRDEELPMHVGFKQMTIILEKEGHYAEAIGYAQQALNAGWGGDWEKRIERYQKKLGKKMNQRGTVSNQTGF